MRAALAPLLLAASSTRSLSVRRITAKMSAQGVLLTKAGKDGAQGDCPFTQYAAMSMQIAGASYKLRPTPPEEKPAWHLDAHGGSMPCWAPNGFEDGADAIADSGAIAKGFLAPSATDTAVMEQVGGLFKGIAMLLKNTDDAKDGELLAGVNDQLDALEACAFAPYLSGAAPGLADAFVATKLYVLFVGGGHFKGYALSERHPKVARYWAAVSAHPAFYRTRYPEAEMLHGWGEARGEGPGCAV